MIIISLKYVTAIDFEQCFNLVTTLYVYVYTYTPKIG